MVWAFSSSRTINSEHENEIKFIIMGGFLQEINKENLAKVIRVYIL